MILQGFATKKSKNDSIDSSGAHLKVGDASRSGGRAPAKAAKANRANPKWHFYNAKLKVARDVWTEATCDGHDSRFWRHLQL